jgi:hypothetical protein
MATTTTKPMNQEQRKRLAKKLDDLSRKARTTVHRTTRLAVIQTLPDDIQTNLMLAGAVPNQAKLVKLLAKQGEDATREYWDQVKSSSEGAGDGAFNTVRYGSGRTHPYLQCPHQNKNWSLVPPYSSTPFEKTAFGKCFHPVDIKQAKARVAQGKRDRVKLSTDCKTKCKTIEEATVSAVDQLVFGVAAGEAIDYLNEFERTLAKLTQ